jgi:hypothetical protein
MSMPHDGRTDLDELGRQADQGPCRKLVEQVSALQEDAEIAGERMDLEVSLVLRHRPA